MDQCARIQEADSPVSNNGRGLKPSAAPAEKEPLVIRPLAITGVD